MKDFLERNTMTIFCTLMTLMIAAVMIFGAYSSPINGDSTDCYDRFSNKIQGKNCIVEGKFDSRTTAVAFACVVGTIFLVIGYTFGAN